MKAIIAVVATALTAVSIGFAAGQGLTTSRQDEVARKGASVMPFDLARTTHIFDDTRMGGVETVIANDKTDTRQISLIRSHLGHEAKRFSHGDFSDPAKVHGQDMPGLAELSGAGEKLHVKYRTMPAGASITYSSADASVIAAVHRWFAAQRSDHAAHAHLHHN